METERYCRELVTQAWRNYASGNLDEALALAWLAHDTNPSWAESAVALGWFLLDAKDFDRAYRVLHEALALQPRHAAAHWYLGTLLYRRGRIDDAEPVLREALEIAPNLHEARITLAWLLHDRGQFDAALEQCRLANANEEQPHRLALLGWLLARRGELEAAAEALRRAVDKAPADVSIRHKLVIVLSRRGCHCEAKEVLLRGLALAPGNPELLLSLARKHWDLGNVKAAQAVALDLSKQHPGLSGGWHLLALTWEGGGDLVQAHTCYARAHELEPDNAETLVSLAKLNRRRGNLDQAACQLQALLDTEPRASGARLLLAQLRLDQGRTDSARRLLHQLLADHGGTADVWRLLAVVLSQKGQPHIAHYAVRRALRLAPESIEILRFAGWLGLKAGKPEQARDAGRVLLTLLPDDPAALAQAAIIAQAVGDLVAAVNYAERAVFLAPDNAECWWRLGQVRWHQRCWREAEDCLETALRLDPGRVEIRGLLARVAIGQDRLAAAQARFQQACDQAPQTLDYRLGLAEVLSLSGRFFEAAEALAQALELKPDSSGAKRLLARCRMEQGFVSSRQWREAHWSEAATLLAALLRGTPHDGAAAVSLVRLAAAGNRLAQDALRLIPRQQRRQHFREVLEWAVAHQGNAECVDLARLAQREFPDDAFIHCAALYIAAISATWSHTEMSRRIRAWGREFALSSGMSTPRIIPPRRRGGRLRVAYLASHLHGSLLLRVLAAHDLTRVEPMLYTDAVDEARAVLKDAVAVQPLSAGDLGVSLVANGIDIAIDTVGLHPFHGQMEVLRALRRRVTPVQCGWLGTWGGGGGIYDALIVDEHTVPNSAEYLYDEQIIRVPGGQWAWTPPLQAHEPGPPPCLERGHVTFGTTVRGLRLTQQTLCVWAELLACVPHSRLELLGTPSRDWRLRADFKQILTRGGIDPERVGFRYRRSYTEHLDFFREVDIYLDAFPGNAGLALLDALWMGVPVVSCARDDAGACWVCERQGQSLLQTIGHGEWAAQSAQGYVRVAADLAAAPSRLMQHRGELRQRLLESPLLDGRRIAETLEAVWPGLVSAALDVAAAPDIKTRSRALAQRQMHACLSRSDSLVLPSAAEPDISVVIVLYNQAGLTLQALLALAEQSGVSFETIIVDNGSSDETASLLQRIGGARVLRNAENLGFLRAANLGAAAARGRHILFLNNDVILQEGALRAALSRLLSASDIGVLGGRIVLADGRLQEAGCIAFGDGSTIGYGRGQDPAAAEYRFVRDIDFCSGAFMLVPAGLWRRLGGFDLRYAPAYYEDTDFCLRVWAAGFRVVYEPEALMLHLEGGSAGAGEPALRMRRNQTVFLQRHAGYLAQRPDALQADLSILRCATRDWPRILIVDDAVPHVVAGSGFVRARQLILSLDRFHVTLFPLWDTESDWRRTYEALPATVEVMLGSGQDDFAAFLKTRIGVYDVLLVSRPPNMAFIAGLRRARPNLFQGIHIVYDSEAVFAVRDIAKAAIRAKPFPRSEQLRRIQEELDCASQAERVLAVSQRDAALFRQAGFPDVRIAAHSQPQRTSSPGVHGRSGMLFVGALNPDTPNEDGLLWFVREVMPCVRGRLPQGFILSIVGECRSNEIAALAASDVHLLGRVDDLVPLYDKARLFIAPVRYAGGVPAKVIEAAGNGLPVVASSVLARQLAWTSGSELIAAHDAGVFAAAIVRLARDDALWLRLRQGMSQRVAEQFDPESFARTVRDAVKFV